MTDLSENFGENSEKPEQVKCYNADCANMCIVDEGYFCSDECKALYHRVSIDKLYLKPTGRKKTFEEWIAIFHERAKDVRITEKSVSNNIEEFVDFLSTPLGEEYARSNN